MSGKSKQWRLALSLSAVAFSGAIAGVSHLSWANAGTRTEAQAEREAQDDADKARTLLAARKGSEAAHWAEQAIALRGDVPAYRALLGQSYLASGRFLSAEAALKDALTLSPGDGRVALNLALAQIGAGNWASARQTLDANAEHIPASDRGLAVALAGDPTAAVDMLTTAARATNADAKTRQNLALAYALSGRWAEARAVAAVDLSPADLDGRIAEWAAFARPAAKADQVASILGVKPINDLGMPVELALTAKKDAPQLAKVEAPAPTPQPVAAPAVTVAEAAPAPAPVQVAAADTPKPGVGSIVFAPRREIVQPLPPEALRAPVMVAAKPARQPVPVAVAAAAQPSRPTGDAKMVKASVAPKFAKAAKGDWYVQLGAFDSPAVAHDAWTRATRRFAGFKGQTAQGKAATVNAKNYYRLSVGGYDRAGAVALCRQYRSVGGTCFVRVGAGDQVASWGKKGEQIASR